MCRENTQNNNEHEERRSKEKHSVSLDTDSIFALTCSLSLSLSLFPSSISYALLICSFTVGVFRGFSSSATPPSFSLWLLWGKPNPSSTEETFGSSSSGWEERHGSHFFGVNVAQNSRSESAFGL
ncbi:hypothetical protein MLD38_012037 [Melastoma candidum]|uniref:Uncharacterized protein n=1 Tax=Melastoma candidum TaxID=119954 RepID=A0ACB9R5L6_9MYRT|nr:hypothetical protein MLD38_012037 [Melastoma candidum]